MKRVILSAAIVVIASTYAAVARAEDPDEAKGWRHRCWVHVPCYVPANPVVSDTGRYVTGAYCGPWGIRHQVNTYRQQVHASALDPDRELADSGSVVYVDRYVCGGWGGSYREQGYHWTSNGVPHADVNIAQRYRTSRFGSRLDVTHVLKDVDEGGEE